MFVQRRRKLALAAMVFVIASCMLLAAQGSGDQVDEEELRKLQGHWENISAIFDGQEVKKDEQAMQFSYTLEGRILTLRLNDKVVGKVEIKHLVPMGPFGHMDLEKTEMAGRLVTGEPRAKMLYKIEGDKLTTCAGMPGADRPTVFASRPGSKVRLSVVKIRKL